MSTTNKARMTIVFALGFLLGQFLNPFTVVHAFTNECRDTIVAILRIFYPVRTSYTPGSDFLWQSTTEFIWSIIEPCLGVIVACAAILRPVF